MKLDMPVLGICRGIQLMNAASGGTLYQDIYEQCEGVFGHNPMKTPVDSLYHTVKIEKGSKLHEIFQSDSLKVNSFHHQAVKRTASNFKVTALSPDGIIEGIEDRTRDFVVGVQWHPEDLSIKYPEFLKLFIKFVEHAYIFKHKRG
jgi:putative glutamine amidotransferase